MYKTYTEKTVNDAVAKGLAELKVTEDDIKIEVLDSGSSGFLGFGKRPAEVKLTVINPELKTYETIEALINRVEKDVKTKVPSQSTEEAIEETESRERVSQKAEDLEENSHEEVEEKDDLSHNEKNHPIEQAAKDTEAYISSIVLDMGIEHTTKMTVKKNNIDINFDAKLAAKIIGKRGQTLNALQVLAQNYFNSIYRSYGQVIIDVGDYRAKRKETLEILALNMADKVRRTEERVKLEPMPNFERKIMHNALSREPGIETYSEGKEPNRYLVITKK